MSDASSSPRAPLLNETATASIRGATPDLISNSSGNLSVVQQRRRLGSPMGSGGVDVEGGGVWGRGVSVGNDGHYSDADTVRILIIWLVVTDYRAVRVEHCRLKIENTKTSAVLS